MKCAKRGTCVVAATDIGRAFEGRNCGRVRALYWDLRIGCVPLRGVRRRLKKHQASTTSTRIMKAAITPPMVAPRFVL